MFNTECKKTVSKMILSFILITVTLLSGCQKNTINSAIEFGTIDVSEIDKIELSGTTGGKDGNYSYTLSDQEKKEFVHLLNQVELGDEVEQLLTISFISKEKTSLHSVRDIISVLMKSIMSLLILMNCGMSLSLSIVNKIPLSKTNGIVLLLAQKPLRQITM